MFHDALGGSWSGLERFSPLFSYLVFTIWIPNLYSEFKKKKKSLKND
jgi:hypothetical protein